MANPRAETLNKVADKSYRNAGNPSVIAEIDALAKTDHQPLEILDLGCGQGDNAAILQARGHIVDGVSLSQSELHAAQTVLRDGFLFNLETGLPDAIKQRRFDVVLCSHVLEHLCYPQQLLTDIQQVLKPNGRLVVALPNLMHYKSRWQLLRGRFQYQDAGLWDYTHFRWYTYQTGAALLTDAGFELAKKTVTGELPWGRFWRAIVGQRAQQRVFAGLRWLSPGLFGHELLYVASASATPASNSRPA